MRIVFDIGHPAHVHHFKNVIKELRKKNHKILLLSRDKDVSFKLLSAYKLNYVALGKNYKSLIKKAISQLNINLKTLKICIKFKPNLLIGRASPNLAFASFILSIPFISFSDTEHARINFIFSFPFAKTIVTPSWFMKDLGKKNIRVDIYFELAYLHPNYFKPDPEVLNLLGVTKDEKFVILRFVSRAASHDIGHSEVGLKMKKKVVKELSKYAKVFISAEEEKLSEDLKQYQIKIPPEKMHDALYYASMYFGESGTMATESAVMGTPSIRIPYLAVPTPGNFVNLEKEGLVYNFTDFEMALEKGIEILCDSDSKKKWNDKKEKLLKSKIDPSAFMVWFIENYPNSRRIMKENPDYQFNFK